jgi:hypothetical protein
MFYQLKNMTAPSQKNFYPALCIAFFLIAFSQNLFAGVPTCNPPSGMDACQAVRTNPRPPGCPPIGVRLPAKESQHRQKTDAALFGGLIGGQSGGDTPSRIGFSFTTSLLVTFGGIWLLLVIVRRRFLTAALGGAARQRNWRTLVFSPSFAVSVFGLSLVGAITGGVMTAPTKVSAGKREKSLLQEMTGAMNPGNKPVFKAAQQIGGSGVNQIGAPVFDQAGNYYVRGGFTGSLNVGANTLQSSQSFDMFFAKYDQNNALVWARQGSGLTDLEIGELAVEGATALAVDPFGNVYVGGSFVKTISLQGGANPGVTLSDNGAAGINYESFVAKYDANGNLLWARGGNSGSPKNASDLEIGQNAVDQIVFDADGNPYLTGFVSGSSFLGSAISVNGQSDIVLAKLDPATGAIVWQQIIGGAKDDNGLDLKISGAGELYLLGNFASESITFPTVPATTFTNPEDPENAQDQSVNTFIAKFNENGDNLWVKNIDNAASLVGANIAVNPAGEIFLTGSFFDSATFGATTLTESEGGTAESEASLGGYVTKMNADGDFIWANGFGGIGEAIALDAAGRIYIAGNFYDGGVFGDGTANAESLASFGGEDLFVARYDTNGGFEWAKPIAGNGVEGTAFIGNPNDPGGVTENSYAPLGIGFNPARGTIFITGNVAGTLSLDCLTLKSPNSRQSYVAELSADDETVSCRIWNGLDPAVNDWDAPANWNGGIIPAAGDSVYVPYTGNNDDAPTFNPTNNVPLVNLIIADDRIFTLEQNITINDRLDLNGGYIDAEGGFTVFLGSAAQAATINDGRVLGKVQKQFAGTTNFTFPVGTLNNYSPVTLSNIAGTGNFAVSANEGQYPNTANNLPANRAARWWNLTNGGLTRADLTFQYAAGDITSGTEANYRAFRIPTGGGAAVQIPSSINTETKTVFAPNVSQFSDWTLAQPLAPTAATATISGRVTNADGRGISGAILSVTDSTGRNRNLRTNHFGYFTVTGLLTGNSYIFNTKAKNYSFAPQLINLNGDLSNLIISALPTHPSMQNKKRLN